MARAQVPFRWLWALVCAACGFLLALLAELTGHPSWTVLLMLICLLAPPMLITFGWVELPESISRLRKRSVWIRSTLAISLVALCFLAIEALGANPREYAYVPLLMPVIVSAFLLGFGPGLSAVILAMVWADFYYAPPVFDFAITEWEDAAGLALFAILGSLLALMIQQPV